MNDGWRELVKAGSDELKALHEKLEALPLLAAGLTERERQLMLAAVYAAYGKAWGEGR